MCPYGSQWTHPDLAGSERAAHQRCRAQISLAIANVKLRDERRDQYARDPLSEPYKRRFFFDSCRQAIHQAGRTGDALSVISLDADNFKCFNDTHDHNAGETVLRAIGDVLGSLFNGREMVARLGGEMFSAPPPGCKVEDATQRANEMRLRIEDLHIRYRDTQLPS